MKNIRSGKNLILLLFFFLISSLIGSAYFLVQSKTQVRSLESAKIALGKNMNLVQAELDVLKNQDQLKINKKLEEEINNTHTTYQNALTSYEKIQDLKAQKQDIAKLEKLYASILKDLSDLKYSSARSTLKELNTEIQKKTVIIAQNSTPKPVQQSVSGAQTALASNTPPSGGFSSQQVSTDIGAFTVAVVAADLNSTRVIVDTASESDCGNDCPVLSLGEYVSRNGAFAGINGSYFCPVTYPSCAGKTNTFDTLLMNKNKKYFNSDNNVYSVVPAVIFKDNWARFVSKSQEWGRDTGVDAVLANQPLLVLNGQVAFGGDGDPKKGSKGVRGFVAAKGSMVYIGVVHNATVVESAVVLKALGMDNALNLDSGGSTALWHGGYKAGPGRNIPNAILFVRK